MSKKIFITWGSLNRAQKDALARLMDEQRTKTERRMQWIMFLALADEFGFGRKRMDRLMQRYFKYINEYGALKYEDAADDILTLRIRQRGWADIYEI